MARGINPPAIGSDPKHYLVGQAADEIERLHSALGDARRALNIQERKT